jgi:hypothetical protein
MNASAAQVQKARAWAQHSVEEASLMVGTSSSAWRDIEQGLVAMPQAFWQAYTATITPALRLIRGIPGSGKSTLAACMVASGESDVHIESDNWLYNDSCIYEWSPARVVIAHAECLVATEAAMRKWRRVVVANTFITQAQLEPYRQLVKRLEEESGLTIPFDIVVARGGWKDVHNVPDQAVANMRSQWED